MNIYEESDSIIYVSGDGITINGNTISADIGTDAGQVAEGNHNHGDDYAAKDHDHDDSYATIGHEHKGYAKSEHTHTVSDITNLPTYSAGTGLELSNNQFSADIGTNKGQVAAGDHTHNDYAKSSHKHEVSDIEDLSDFIPEYKAGAGLQLADNTFAVKFGTEGTEVARGNHTHDYAASDHNHDSSYATINHTHDYAASDHNHDSSYATINHTHSIQELNGFGYNVPGVNQVPICIETGYDSNSDPYYTWYYKTVSTSSDSIASGNTDLVTGGAIYDKYGDGSSSSSSVSIDGNTITRDNQGRLCVDIKNIIMQLQSMGYLKD